LQTGILGDWRECALYAEERSIITNSIYNSRSNKIPVSGGKEIKDEC
jgi:hypothetical protein